MKLFILSARPVSVIDLMEIAVTLFNVILLSESVFCENVFCDIPEQAFGMYGTVSRTGVLPSSSL